MRCRTVHQFCLLDGPLQLPVLLLLRGAVGLIDSFRKPFDLPSDSTLSLCGNFEGLVSVCQRYERNTSCARQHRSLGNPSPSIPAGESSTANNISNDTGSGPLTSAHFFQKRLCEIIVRKQIHHLTDDPCMEVRADNCGESVSPYIGHTLNDSEDRSPIRNRTEYAPVPPPPPPW